MNCAKPEYKELLPAYLENGLGQADRLRIEEHCRSCEDCSAELELLRMLAEEAVPDPGEAFWAVLPGRVRRDAETKRTPTPSLFDRVFGQWSLPRLSWAAAALLVVASLSWVLVKSRTETTGPLPTTGLVASIDETETVDTGQLAELSSQEFQAVSRWAENAFVPVKEAVAENLRETSERDLSEDLADLSSSELDRLDHMLKQEKKSGSKYPRTSTLGDYSG